MAEALVLRILYKFKFVKVLCVPDTSFYEALELWIQVCTRPEHPRNKFL